MACSDCSELKEAQEQAAFWKAHAKDMERHYKAVLLEKKELVSKLEKLRTF